MWDDEAKTMFRIPWKHAGKHDFRKDEDAALFKVMMLFLSSAHSEHIVPSLRKWCLFWKSWTLISKPSVKPQSLFIIYNVSLKTGTWVIFSCVAVHRVSALSGVHLFCDQTSPLPRRHGRSLKGSWRTADRTTPPPGRPVCAAPSTRVPSSWRWRAEPSWTSLSRTRCTASFPSASRVRPHTADSLLWLLVLFVDHHHHHFLQLITDGWHQVSAIKVITLYI